MNPEWLILKEKTVSDVSLLHIGELISTQRPAAERPQPPTRGVQRTDSRELSHPMRVVSGELPL